ncbi:hypothetical protein [Novosphingobium terrae]|uniref:hypothetical protein n=1 Tax=Novosphingobium terrae TaxID=2726189 RepID=UPI00197E12D9|nr:hypothetical protein [Novosphingobium terrae]
MKIVPLTVMLLLIGAGSSAMADTTKDQSRSSSHIPAMRLERPDWQPLTNEQVQSLFSDRKLEFDERYEPFPGAKVSVRYIGGCPPIESFFADGTWQMYFCSRGPMTFHGRWTVEPHGQIGWLCVQSAERPTDCRVVWQGSAVNEVIMQLKVPGAERIWGSDGAYNPYRLVSAAR